MCVQALACILFLDTMHHATPLNTDKSVTVCPPLTLISLSLFDLLQRVLTSYSEILSSGLVRLLLVSDRDLAPTLLQEAQQQQQLQLGAGVGGPVAMVAAAEGGVAPAVHAANVEVQPQPLPAVVIGAL